MINVYVEDIKKFIIKVTKQGRESLVEFYKIKKEDKNVWEGKSSGEINLDNTFPGHYNMPMVLHLFNKAVGCAVLKTVNGWDISEICIK